MGKEGIIGGGECRRQGQVGRSDEGEEMIVIGMDPILVQLGDFALSWHSLFIVVGIVAGVWLTTRLVTRAGLSA